MIYNFKILINLKHLTIIYFPDFINIKSLNQIKSISLDYFYHRHFLLAFLNLQFFFED